jgi:hypothetical protein
MTITLTPNPENTAYVVKDGVTFLAVVSFDGPRGTIVTHQGALRADERKAVYALHAATQFVVRPQASIGRRTKQYGIYRGSELIEGGFFVKAAADLAALQHARGSR